jgi:hypothetical protein
MYCIQHCFICRPSDSTVSEDAVFENLLFEGPYFFADLKVHDFV